MTMAFDYKKEYKEFYLPPKTPGIVTVPAMDFLAVRGEGDPNQEDGAYKQAIGLLYAVAFTIKMSKKGGHKLEGYFDYVVPPLEGLWWQEGLHGVDYSRKQDFRWISLIRLPQFVTREVFDWAIREAMEKKRKEYEAEQVQQNIKMREQEHLITLQQQQLLEAELSAKSKDLASMALGVFAKNEVLEKLRTVVQESLVKGQYGRKNLESLLKLINENIETQEFWDVFQNNFDLIHEKFFRNLRERYPSLTATDLRFCALLRLNLSTKDIAQMTNLTIRGVEAARYRLRKKLDIPDGTGLVDFLIDLK